MIISADEPLAYSQRELWQQRKKSQWLIRRKIYFLLKGRYISYTLAVTLLIFILGEADLFVMCFRGKLIRQEHVHFINFFSDGFHASAWEVEVGRSEVQDYL